jgi:hypothetical protein
MSNWTKADLQRQLHQAKAQKFVGKSLYAILHDAAAAEGLPFSLVLAVASRETNVKNIAGDGGHGCGPMQLDNRSHHIPADWPQDPTEVVRLCCELLKDLHTWAHAQYLGVTANWWKIALSAYNAGQRNAARGAARGDSDRYTTGADYGRDVQAREKIFLELLA